MIHQVFRRSELPLSFWISSFVGNITNVAICGTAGALRNAGSLYGTKHHGILLERHLQAAVISALSPNNGNNYKVTIFFCCRRLGILIP